jgi:hypothetical protein
MLTEELRRNYGGTTEELRRSQRDGLLLGLGWQRAVQTAHGPSQKVGTPPLVTLGKSGAAVLGGQGMLGEIARAGSAGSRAEILSRVCSKKTDHGPPPKLRQERHGDGRDKSHRGRA